mgnify:CR=1 FL=1
MKVGDIVFALKNDKMFPGKIHSIIDSKTFLVTFFYSKKPQKIHLKDILHFTSELAQKYSENKDGKRWSLALKWA